MNLKMPLLIGLVVVGLSGCSLEQKAAMAYAQEGAITIYDTEAKILMMAPCAMNVGSYWRALNSQQRAAVDLLCGK